VAIPVIAWVLALCFSRPDVSLVQAKVIIDCIRAGFFVIGVAFATIALLEVARRGTSGLLLAGLVGVVFNSLGIVGAVRNLPDEVRIYRAGSAAADLNRLEAGIDFQNLANPNLLKDKASLEAQRARLEQFRTTLSRDTEVIEAGKQVLVNQTMKPGASTDRNLAQQVTVVQHINAKLELWGREARLAEAAINLLSLLIDEWGRWKTPPDSADPAFESAESARRYKSLNQARLEAEQGLAGQQQQIFGQPQIHPGERIVSVATFNPPLPVQARTPAPAPRSAATVPSIIDYTKLDLENPAEAAATAAVAARTLTGEDALVSQAWSAVLSNLVVASREVERSAKTLGAADVLNGGTISRQGSVSVSDQFVNRRKIANDFGTAVHNWEQRVSGLSGQYLGQLYQFNVPPDRAQIERDRLSAATAEKVQLQLKICALERDIALGYNRAVGSLETYQIYAAASPGNPGAIEYNKKLAGQTAELQELQRSLARLRQPAKAQ
jgi:hypothetical protein